MIVSASDLLSGWLGTRLGLVDRQRSAPLVLPAPDPVTGVRERRGGADSEGGRVGDGRNLIQGGSTNENSEKHNEQIITARF